MLKKYCVKCGQATEYASELPSFCSKCGNSLLGRKANVVSSITQKKTTVVSSAKDLEDVDDYEQDDDFNTNITSLAFEVERFDPPTPTIGQIASLGPQEEGQASDQNVKNDIPANNAPVDDSKVIEDFQREAGSIRQRNDG